MKRIAVSNKHSEASGAKMDDLGVFIHGERVGSLSRQNDGATLFSRAGCERKDQVVSLDWAIDEDVLSPRGSLHPVFEQYLPEGHLRQHIEEAFHQILKVKDDLTLLRIVGSSLIGRLRFAESADALRDVPPVNIKEDILAGGGPDILATMLERYAQYSGVAGVQPKILVRNEGAVANKVSVSGATHIAKTFDAAEYPGLAMNEWVCLNAASRAGLIVPDAEVSADGSWIIVTRFDLNEETGRYAAFEDMCSLAGVGTKYKYIGSYEQLAKVVSKFSSSPKQDLSEFFKSVVLTCAVRNGDAHRKNFGIMYSSAVTARLAPQFDIICTDVYPRLDSRTALRINGSDRWPSAKKLKRFGVDSCWLSPSEAEDIIASVCDAVSESRDLLNDPRMPVEVAEQMENAFEAGLASLCETTTRRMRMGRKN